MIDQIVIGACGASSVWLSQSTLHQHRRLACLFGLAAQPFWFYATWKAQQYGIMALTLVYTMGWARGFWSHWIRSEGTT